MTSIMRLNNYIEAAHLRSHNTNYKRYCTKNCVYSFYNRNADYKDKIRINQWNTWGVRNSGVCTSSSLQAWQMMKQKVTLEKYSNSVFIRQRQNMIDHCGVRKKRKRNWETTFKKIYVFIFLFRIRI